MDKFNGQVSIQIRLIPIMRYFKWDTKSRRLATLRDLSVLFKMGRTANL